MPLGSFRLNGISKLAGGVAGWAGWNGSLDGSDTELFPNTHTAFGAVDNDYGIVAYRDSDTNTYARPISKSGSTLSLGGANWIDLGQYFEGNDTATGTFVFSADRSFGYYCSKEQVTRLNSISSSSFSVSNKLGSQDIANAQRGMRMTSDNKIQGFFNTRMIEATVTGTSTISISNSTTTFTNLPASTTCVSVASISDTQHIRIQCNTGTGAVSAWLCTRGNATASQIGSTITDGASYTFMFPGGRYSICDLKHNKALGFGFNNTTKEQRFYIATSSTFTAYSVSSNTIGTNINNDCLNAAGTGCVSLDENRFMMKNNGATNELFWIFNVDTGTTQAFSKFGSQWENRTRSSIAPWNNTTVFSGNWKSASILRIAS